MVQGARLLAFSRGYATHRPASRLNGALSLDHVGSHLYTQTPAEFLRKSDSKFSQETHTFREQFLQRQRALSLYRTILRGTKNISDPATKAETRKFARDEFERHRNVTDLVSLPLGSQRCREIADI